MNRVDRDLRALEAERNRLVTKPELKASVGSVAWTSITGKPSTFSPSAHTHPQSDIVNLVSDLAGKATLANTLDEFANPAASLDFAQQQTLQFVIENRTSDPGSPATGQMWLRTDL